MPKHKSQVPVDFLLSLVIFIIVLLIISNSIIQNIFLKEERKDRASALLLGFAISELLLHDKGIPNDWNNIYYARRLGFAEDFYKLKREKVLAINNCNLNDYERIKSLLSIPAKMDFKIIIKKTNEEILAICGKDYPYRKFLEIKRVSSLDNEIVLLIIRVYY
ncbi:MAG: hypothetical protein QXL09_00840 [Candidatus Aenigmatarchaeota archaeon]